MCVWFLWCRLRLFVCVVCLFVWCWSHPPPSFGLVGFILSAPPWPPSAPPRTPNVCWPFPFQIPTINSCVCVGGGGEKIPRKRFLFGETEKGRERERERERERGWVGLVMSCHVMSCHVMVRKGFCLSIRSLIMMLQNPHLLFFFRGVGRVGGFGPEQAGQHKALV